MKGKGPMMIIAIGIGKKRKGDKREEMMEDEDEMGGGGMTGYGSGGRLPMVERDGEKVPFFAADGKGKMLGGGMTYGKGGMTRGNRDGCAIKGKTKGRMI